MFDALIKRRKQTNLIEKVDRGIYAIDQMWTGNPKFSSCYLIEGDKIALFDTGLTIVVDRVLDSVEKIGYSPEDISYLIFSHIHCDHAGGAGSLCKNYPHLKVFAHEKGVPHLANPERLYKSMKKVFGDNAEKLYGNVIPVPEHRLHPLKDGEIIGLGKDRKLKVFHTPGHASHHLSLYDEKNKVLFAGEALGIYFPEVNVYFPSTPPPEFNLKEAVDSIRRLEKLEMRKVFFTHFGPAKNPQFAIQRSKEMLIDWGGIINEAMNESNDKSYISGRLFEEALKCIDHIKNDPEKYNKYKALIEFRSNFTCGPGYVRYFKKGGQVL